MEWNVVVKYGEDGWNGENLALSHKIHVWYIHLYLLIFTYYISIMVSHKIRCCGWHGTGIFSLLIDHKKSTIHVGKYLDYTGILVLHYFWDAKKTVGKSIGKKSLTLPETNSLHLKIDHPKRKLVFQTSIFRCYVSFRECKRIKTCLIISSWFQ